jgi:DNA-binding MarR family transcriptional regulator
MIVEQLQQLGFSQYEAQAYITLLQRSPLNGYELAKISGIPRPNIYSVLQKLEERGAVVRMDSPEGTRYSPVASEELIQRLRSHFQDSLEAARRSLEAVKTAPEEEHVWNARGYPALLEHARSFVEAASRELLVAVWPAEAEALSTNLEAAHARGVKITTLCLAGCPGECGSCRGQIHRYPIAPEQETHCLLLVPDESEVLAGEVGPEGVAVAVRTRQRLLVNLASWYIRQSIALSVLLLNLGDRLDGLIDPRTRDLLESLAPAGAPGGWLDEMHRLLKNAGAEGSSF